MCKNTHVPDKLEGYLLQVRHALFELIPLEDRIISVEAYDDVAVESDDVLIAEQMKSVLSSSNPVANRSEVFWKCLKNWCEYLNSGELPNKTVALRYVVVANRNLTIGEIPKMFDGAKTEKDASDALEAARDELFGSETNPKQPSFNKNVKEYIDYCFAAENKATMLHVICAMEIDLHEDSYDSELRVNFNRQTIPEEYSENLFVSMLGWVQEKIHQQTKQNKPAFILSEDYRKELKAQVRSRDIRHILTAVSIQPDTSTTASEIERHDTYIKQLEIIDTDTTEIYNAASDFLHTKSERIEWAKLGIVTEDSLREYSDALTRIWNNNRIIVNCTPNVDEVGKGKLLLAHCQNDSIRYLLQGATTPSFFGPGSLHALANEPSTNPAIGWHPRYTLLLEVLKDAE